MSSFRRRLMMMQGRGGGGVNTNIITIDQTISDPSKMIGGDVKGDVIQWIRENSHRVLAKKTAEGEVTYCRLDDANSNLYYDGSPADLTGIEGDVFVKLPTFYYRGNDDGVDGQGNPGASGDNVTVTFSKEPFEDCVEWDTNALIGAYEAYAESNMLYSRSGVSSSGSISQDNLKSYSRNRGTGYQLVDWQMHCVMGILFYAWYGNTNSQGICGSGTSSYTKETGQTDELGMNDTEASVNGNSQSINFWGLENWWGNKYEWVDNVYATGKDNVEVREFDPEPGRIFYWSNDSAYGKHYRFGKYCDLSSDTSSSGSDKTYFCDYNYGPDRSPRVVRRSFSYASASGGVSYADAYYAPSSPNTAGGSRLAFRGLAREAQSVGAFKAL